jgi:hypothetical protein
MHPFAVSTSTGTATLLTLEGHSGMSTVAKPLFEPSGGQEITMVNEDYLNLVIAEDDTPICIKLDVEGNDFDVLQALSKCDFFPRTAEIFVEMNPEMSDTSGMNKWFFDNGFVESWRARTAHWDDVLFVRKN